jgi:predicted CXXCH cytochrome family protein
MTPLAGVILAGGMAGQPEPDAAPAGGGSAAESTVGTSAGRGVAGSAHDFSGTTWAAGDLCGACHTPHRELPPKAAPLWDDDADLNERFGIFMEGKMPPGEGTLMCLRCHDGTIAKDTLGGAAKEKIRQPRHPGLFTAGHGTSDHPVGVRYPQFDKFYRPVTSVVAHGVPLPDARVECSSCHDPHNRSGEPDMLVISNARSRLCLTCHIK